MADRVKLAVAGAGQIGRRHVESIAASADAALLCIVDPEASAQTYAAGLGVPWFSDLGAMLGAQKPDGVILATPNALHVEQGLACVASGIPVLVEKPISVDVSSARKLVEAAEAANVPLLVGHHRRHNPLMRAAKDKLDSGAVGTIVAVHSMFWLFKPDDYFDVAWRRQPGAGPVLSNLIHDVDLMRWLCGEVATVQAQQSNAVRGNPVEETAAVLIRFESGALGTAAVSDTIVAPWSWEMTSAEDPSYPPADQFCYLIGGSHGSLEVPSLRVWSNPGRRSWKEPLRHEVVPFQPQDPLIRQIDHFARVIRGEEAPVVSGREGMKTLAVIEAVKQSARTGEMVRIAV